ncbi:MAG: alanine racemase [Peptococcaceae bacterium]
MYKWVEIDLDALEENYLQVRKYVRKETKILGVVKADAYGHGIVEVSKELQRLEVDYLGVTEVSEGIQLRQAGIVVPILVFGNPLPEDIDLLREFNLTITLGDINTVKIIIENDIPIRAHLKLETGLGRTGLKYSELDELVNLLKETEKIAVEGVYSHFATAMWDNLAFTTEQYNKFLEGAAYLEEKGLTIPIKHICNSAALAKFPEMHLDMVRAGTILYGQEVAGRKAFRGKLTDCWSLKGQIIYINELPRGHSIGYERAYILRRKSRTALIPIGFFHGFSVEPVPRPKGLLDLIKIIGKNILRFFDHSRVRTYARVNERAVPVIGKVGMQTTILDVTDLPQVKIGDTVDLPGRRTNIIPNIPKVFLKEGKPVKIRKMQEKYEELSMAAK